MEMPVTAAQTDLVTFACAIRLLSVANKPIVFKNFLDIEPCFLPLTL
jgi:hypothetical protein